MTATLTASRAVDAPLRSRAPRGVRAAGMGASILVATISTAFGVVLLATTDFLAALLRADPYIGGSETLAFVLNLLAVVLLAVAVYVAAIVTANTFATVVAGRTRQIALLRLIGASARSQRAEIGRLGLTVGAVGAALGTVCGIALAWLGIRVATAVLSLAAVEVNLLSLTLLAPAVVVTLTTWAAAWAGSRRVLTVTPLQALGGSVEASGEDLAAQRPRHIGSIALLALGALLLAGGILLGLVSPYGLFLAFFGGLLSFTGLAVGSTLIMPPALALVGRVFGSSVPARLAAQNARRSPERSARMAIGVVIGVTLVTMFAVAVESTKSVLTAASGGRLDPDLAIVMDTFSGVMMGLVAVSAVIAAVGLVNLLTLGIVQRRRELALLRALGVSNRQVRAMVLIEAAHVTITATLTGVVFGVFYGWAGAQSLLGSVPLNPDSPGASTFVWPAVPLAPLGLIVVATAVLTLVAAVTPTRLATGVSPVAALAE